MLIGIQPQSPSRSVVCDSAAGWHQANSSGCNSVDRSQTLLFEDPKRFSTSRNKKAGSIIMHMRQKSFSKDTKRKSQCQDHLLGSNSGDRKHSCSSGNRRCKSSTGRKCKSSGRDPRDRSESKNNRNRLVSRSRRRSSSHTRRPSSSRLFLRMSGEIMFIWSGNQSIELDILNWIYIYWNWIVLMNCQYIYGSQ